MNTGLNEIHGYIGGTLHRADVPLTGISIDTRTLSSDAAYIAIQGEQYDSHDFVESDLAQMQPVIGRLQPMLTSLGNIIINDGYNPNPKSLTAGEHWVILGAFGELGTESKNIHKQLIKSKGVVRLAAVGPDAESTVNAFGKGAIFFNSLAALIDFLKQQLTGNEVLLIKGSRVQRMEQVSLALTEQEVV